MATSATATCFVDREELTMSDGSEINLLELDAHRKRLESVLDHVGAAADAAVQSIDAEAFGLLGVGLAAMCGGVQDECGGHIRELVGATNEHIEQVGEWRTSVEHREQARADLFEEMIDLD
jgi:hypothetical protein